MAVPVLAPTRRPSNHADLDASADARCKEPAQAPGDLCPDVCRGRGVGGDHGLPRDAATAEHDRAHAAVLAGRAGLELAAFDGGVQNPALADPGDGVVDFSAGAYPGFSDVVDLRARGQLSDELVFRVRAQQAALWRAEVFDTYDGATWTIDDDRTVSLEDTGERSLQVPRSIRERNMAQPDADVRMTQTFYIEVAQPNVLFGASSIDQVYFPAGGLRVDRAGSIRAPILLDEGLIYSVESQLPVLGRRSLGGAERARPRGADALPAVAVRDAGAGRGARPHDHRVGELHA